MNRKKLDQLAAKLQREDIFKGVPIAGATGLNGAGKTLLAAQSIMADLSRGRDVYSTVHVTSPWGDTKPIKSLRQLLTLKDATLFLDDVSVIFSSRSTTSLPPEMVAVLDTLRHKGETGLTVRWTAPTWMRCDNLIRGITQASANVMKLPLPFTTVNDGSPWPRSRIMLVGLLDTTTGKADETPTRVMRRRMYVLKNMASFGAYNTRADTPLLGARVQSGVCVDCRGLQTKEKCSPERHEKMDLPWYDDEDVFA